MTQTLDELRIRVHEHAIHQDYMQKTVEKMNVDVRDIKRAVFQVKWALVGGVIFYIANLIGFVDAVKLLF